MDEGVRGMNTGFVFSPLQPEGAFIIQNCYSGDNRGSFQKCLEKDIFRENGIPFELNETFVSVSAKNVIRGIHFQLSCPQAKLVTVLSGRIWDVIVDLRMTGTTYKKWTAVELSQENHKSIYVPRGFGHGFAALEDNSTVLYQCDGKYDKETDTGIIFDDPEIGISWPVDKEAAIHSQRDLGFSGIAEYERNPMRI